MKTFQTMGIVLALTCASIPVSSLAADAAAKAAAKPANNKQVERGQYLVMITGCNDCHTPNFLVNGGKTAESDRLVGGKLGWRGPWGTTYPVNLRLLFQEMSEEQWVQIAKEIQRRPPMPYFSLNAMSGPDVRAIYRYINSLGAAGAPAPKFLFSSATPPQPFIQYPD